MEGKNRYWIMRHGKSVANQKHLIVSSLENGILPEYQLVPQGIVQAQLAGQLFLQQLKEKNIALETVRICYSPLARTSHTAKVIASVFNIPFDGPHFQVMEDLGERYFGPTFELMPLDDKHPELSALHEKDPCTKPEDGGESAKDVANRLASSMAQMGSQFQGCVILIVSHGDSLQILQALIQAVKEHPNSTHHDLASRIQAVNVPTTLTQHRKFSLLTGEIRAVI